MMKTMLASALWSPGGQVKGAARQPKKYKPSGVRAYGDLPLGCCLNALYMGQQ